MEMKIYDNGNVKFDNARIVFRNFAGKAGMYNKDGERKFAVVIPDREIADALADEGWNVRIKPPRNEEESEFIYMDIKVRFKIFEDRATREKTFRGPSCYLISGDNMEKLNPDTVGILDEIAIENVTLDIRPWDWNSPDGRSGRSAELVGICVTQKLDRFEEMYQRFNNR